MSFVSRHGLHDGSRHMTNTMMSAPVLEGVAESGYGVRLAGFHIRRADYAKRLAEFQEKFPAVMTMAVWESDGYVTFLGGTTDRSGVYVPSQPAVFIREPHKFFIDLPAFLRSTRALWIHQMLLSGSLGSITLTLLAGRARTDA